jgi:replicative DNA helicase
VARGTHRLEDVAAANPLVGAATTRLAEYADRLWLLQASSAESDLEELRAMVARHRAPSTVLVVDYLQKVAVPERGLSDIDRVTLVATGLKELALAEAVAVVAVTSTEGAALDEPRLRTHHVRGAGALAYEADVIVMLNEKFTAVSKVHTAYDPVRAETFKGEVVFTVEKNRDGPACLDMEFRKDFEHFRFVPSGAFVAERLIDGRMYPD